MGVDFKIIYSAIEYLSLVLKAWEGLHVIVHPSVINVHDIRHTMTF